MLFEFADPKPVLMSQGMKDGEPLPGVPLPFVTYLEEIIFALPYWRSTDEAAAQAEEVLDQISARVPVFVVRGGTLEALRTQMRLAESAVIQMNPRLVRPSIRYVRVVNNARKHVEPEPEKRSLPNEPET